MSQPAVATPPDGGPQAPPAAPPPGPPGALTLIGTGHVFQVRQTIRWAIEALRPDVVFVELDRGRLHALMERQKGAPAATHGGFVQKRLAKFQEEVAGLYGAAAGEEMLAAVEAGQAVGARIALIDAPADATLRRAVRELTWRERLRAVGLMVKGGFLALGRRGGTKRDLERELRRYQDDPDAALKELEETFPTLHRIVIAERDALMARRIAQLLPGARHGVAVVGDGHVGGLVRLLDDFHPTVYRMADVRAGRLPKPATAVASGGSESVTFGFDAQA